MAPRPRLQEAETKQLEHPPFTLDERQRRVVEGAVREVCLHRKYLLRGITVRTDHAHTVVTATHKPEPMLDAFKAYSTRALRQAGLLDREAKPWARHGSTIYLWKERDVEKAMEYVLLGQGEELPPFD